jgi:hypothetical protein
MRTFFVGVAVIVAVLIPSAATGETTAASDDHSPRLDIVHVEMDGSGSGNADVNVFGTLRCGTGAGPLNFDVTLVQPSTGGTGAGASRGYTCRPGKTIKWVLTAQGLQMMVDDPIKVTVEAALVDLPPFATATEVKVLRWGLHFAAD